MSKATSGWLDGVKNRAAIMCGVLGVMVMLTHTSSAALIVKAQEIGGDVVFSWGGAQAGPWELHRSTLPGSPSI